MSAVASHAATTSTYTAVASGASWLLGFAFDETTGSAKAKLVIRDSTNMLVPITLSKGQSTSEFAGRRIPVSSGIIKVEVVEGEVEGMVLWE